MLTELSREVQLLRRPTADEAIALVDILFPVDGDVYLVGSAAPIAKAKPGAQQMQREPFETWFLDLLEHVMRERAVTTQDAIWECLDRLLAAHDVRIPSELDPYVLHRTLSDLTHGSTARMVGISVPPDVQQRLAAVGFPKAELGDFPALAYRMGKLYEALNKSPELEFPRLVELVENAYPLSPAEEIAVNYARNRAGMYLRPVFNSSGQLWSTHREVDRLREVVPQAIAERRSPFEVAGELRKLDRAQGIVRDAERVVCTEIANARNRGNWDYMKERFRWTPETLVYRRPSPHACDACKRIYTDAGNPRLFRVSEVEALDALGPNTGPQAEWVAKIGATHPYCVCGPWLQHIDVRTALHAV